MPTENGDSVICVRSLYLAHGLVSQCRCHWCQEAALLKPIQPHLPGLDEGEQSYGDGLEKYGSHTLDSQEK